MTKRNDNRQQVLFECVAAAFFLPSRFEPTKHDSAVQTSALLGQTPGSTRGQMAPDLRDGGGCLVPVSCVQQRLEGRLFQFSKKVAGFPFNTLPQDGSGREGKFYKRGSESGRYSGGTSPVEGNQPQPDEAQSAPQTGLEPATEPNFPQEITETGKSRTDSAQESGESKVGTKPAHDSGRHNAAGDRADGPGGGLPGGRIQNIRWVGTNAEFWAKAVRFERL